MFEKTTLCSYFNHIYIDIAQLFIDKTIKYSIKGR